MLSETIGTFIFVLTAVTARDHMKRSTSAGQSKGIIILGAMVMAIGLMTVQLMFREFSGGVCNPAIAFAKIVWQEFTLDADRNSENSPWTYEYALSYFIGPIAGALAAGVSFNIMRDTSHLMQNYPAEMQARAQAVAAAKKKKSAAQS